MEEVEELLSGAGDAVEDPRPEIERKDGDRRQEQKRDEHAVARSAPPHN